MNSRDRDSTRSKVADCIAIERQLCRPLLTPQRVMRRTANGSPAVIRVDSFVDGTFFPSFYWLVDPALNQLIYRYESKGATRQVQKLIDLCPKLQQRLLQDNNKHVRQRETFFDEEIRTQLQDLGGEESFKLKGISGTNIQHVNCLHTYLAAHLVEENLVGELVLSMFGPMDPLVIALSQIH